MRENTKKQNTVAQNEARMNVVVSHWNNRIYMIKIKQYKYTKYTISW